MFYVMYVQVARGPWVGLTSTILLMQIIPIVTAHQTDKIPQIHGCPGAANGSPCTMFAVEIHNF